MICGGGLPNFAVANDGGPLENQNSFEGVLAQLVERLNGIEEVRGSIPLGSTISKKLWSTWGRARSSTGGARYAQGFEAKL